MAMPSLFDAPVSPIRARLQTKLASLAAQQIYLGTSSWKYEGWLGQIFTEDRYITRGKFSRKMFEEQCIAEYAEVFPIVCGDFAFYQFPTQSFWEKLFTTAPPKLRWAFKVPEEITVKQWPGHARYGARAGLENENFLNADLFKGAFLNPLTPYKDRISTMIFEFGTISKKTMPNLDAFLSQVNKFLSELPDNWRYSIEIRNPEFLEPDYFSCLRSYNVAHVLNAWTRMPELGIQLQMDDIFTADFTVVRALLKYGRTYESAVKSFEPYKSVQEENPAARDALKAILARAQRIKQPAFVFVNNRLEGNAPGTIDAVTELI
ncbi:MAG: DUF72 domain-containing protein [Acidobacteria bacterium]|nr:DUF72 domain-containing protein [Acidobacteriota bacterium]